MSCCKALALAPRLVPAGRTLLGQKLGRQSPGCSCSPCTEGNGHETLALHHLTWGSEVSVSFLCPKMPAGPCEHHNKCLCSAPLQPGRSRPRKDKGGQALLPSMGLPNLAEEPFGTTEIMVTCLVGLQTAPAQPQPPAQQSLLLLSCTQQPQSRDTLKMPRGNSSITTTGPQGYAADMLLSQEPGPHFCRCSAQHLLPPVLHLSQYEVIYPWPVMPPGPASQPHQEFGPPTPNPSSRAHGCTSLCQSTSVTEVKSVLLPLGFTLTALNCSFASVIAPLTATCHQETIW